MPDKDGSEDKKSTKSVVNKRQKQFMNQEEQLDLSSVAESFGGRIVGEPVELDEIAPAIALGGYLLPTIATAIGAYGTARQIQGKPLIPNIFATADTRQRRKRYKNKTVVRNQPFSWGTFKKSDNNNKNNKNKDNKRGLGFGLGLGSGLGTSTAISTLTKSKKKGAGGGFRLGGLPGTAHNVGRRTNPQ